MDWISLATGITPASLKPPLAKGTSNLSSLPKIYSVQRLMEFIAELLAKLLSKGKPLQ